ETDGLNTMPVGVAVTVPTAAVVLLVGVAPPISRASRTPIGAEPLTNCVAVTTARPRLFVPRSGSMAIAMGEVSTAMGVAVRDVGGDDPNNKARLISETLLLPVFVTRAAPVPSLIATPVGVDPTVTAATFCVPVARSSMEAVPSVWFATTARPKRGLTAIPCGAVPVAIEDLTTPNVVLCGLMSITEILLQPLLLTTAIGEND